MELKVGVQYSIGTEVCPKKTGLPGVGMVVATYHPTFYIATTKPKNTLLWDILFPGWKEKLIYVVAYKEKRKSVSKEDLRIAYPNINEEAINIMYDNAMETSMMYYVEDDLEKFDG